MFICLFSMETPDFGSINFSENMTAAFDTTMETKKVFTITSGIDETKVYFRFINNEKKKQFIDEKHVI